MPKIIGVVLGIIFVALFVLSGWWIWQQVWNWVVFGIFGVFRPITFWESAGISIFVGLILGALRRTITVQNR
jgi:hypothetical protein